MSATVLSPRPILKIGNRPTMPAVLAWIESCHVLTHSAFRDTRSVQDTGVTGEGCELNVFRAVHLRRRAAQ